MADGHPGRALIRYPVRLDLKTGFSCNNRCTFCVQGDRRARQPDRDTAEILALLDASRAGHDEVVLTGGECTLRPDILVLVRHAASLRYRVQVQSNGRRFSDPGFCDAIVEAGATEFSPALHGSTAHIHESQTRAPGSFKQVLKGIRNLRSRGQAVITNSVVTRQNLEDLPGLGALLVALDVQQYQLAMVHPLGTALLDFHRVVPRLAEAAPWVRAGLQPGIKGGIRVMAEAVPPCLMRGYEAQVAERYIPATRIEDVGRVVPDYTRARVGEGKAKGPPCVACTWNTHCEGPWREYPQAHGWDDLVPRADTPPTTGLLLRH